MKKITQPAAPRRRKLTPHQLELANEICRRADELARFVLYCQVHANYSEITGRKALFIVKQSFKYSGVRIGGQK